MADAKDGVTKIICVLVLLLYASVAVAQNTQTTVAPMVAKEAGSGVPEANVQTARASIPSEKTPAAPLKMSYVGGQLRIDALDSTMRDVLTKVAALTGVKIEIPAGATSERLPVVKLGPGSARQILASLLGGSSFDYLIQASPTDPEGIQNVVLIPREKKGSGGNGADPGAHPTTSPYARTIVSPSKSDETPEPSSPLPAQLGNAAAEMSSLTPAPTPTQPEPSTQQDQLAPPPTSLINRSGLTTEGAMNPPTALDQQSINQQLRQMYQGRMQMTQQDHPSVPPPAPANPGNQ